MLKHALFGLAITIAAPAYAAPVTMSAQEAFDAMEAGEMILVDIRAPREWNATGVAQGAVPIAMQSPDFARDLGALLAANPDRTIGLICATGGRSQYLASVLDRNGLTGVVDVTEGMRGNRREAGWIARGLPVVPAATARETFEALVAGN